MPIRLRQDGAVGTIVIESAAKRGAVTSRDVEHLGQALADCHSQMSMRTVIVTGAEETYCSGTDLTTLFDATESEADRLARWHRDVETQRALLEQMLRFPKPILSAVGGAAAGFGLAMMLAGDLTVATASATFGLPEVRLGLVPGLGATMLAWRYGAGIAARLAQTGQMIPAEEAHRLGLVSEIVDGPGLWARAHGLGQEIARTHDGAILLTRRLINEDLGENLLGQLRVAAAATATGRFAEAAREGVTAFLDRRSPEWSPV